jgi:hypothetical protein
MKQTLKDLAAIAFTSIGAMCIRVADEFVGYVPTELGELTQEQELERMIHPDMSSRMN